MISAACAESLDRAFESGLRNACSITGRHPILIEQAESSVGTQTTREIRRIATCNISSFEFRIVFFFEFKTNRATESYLRSKFQIPHETESHAFLDDASAEFVNMSCGAIKGTLTSSFPLSGMSTPHFLEAGCMHQFDALKPAHVRHLSLSGDDDFNMRICYCVCVGRNASLDFRIEEQKVMDDSSGALELF